MVGSMQQRSLLQFTERYQVSLKANKTEIAKTRGDIDDAREF